MKIGPIHEGRRWLLQAEQDLDDAEYNVSGGRHNVACFLGQQAAEKALKAYLYFRGAEEIWGHSVAELCKDAGTYDPEFEKLEKHAALLDKYYVPTRYPNALPGGIPSRAFDEGDSRRAIGLARDLLDMVKSKAESR